MYMKSLRFGSVRSARFLLISCAVLAAYSGREAAAEDDLPPPAGFEEEVEPGPQMGMDDDVPAPSLGDEDLPDPSVSGPMSDEFRVNREELGDEVYLPAPVTQDTVSFDPATARVVAPTTVTTDYWRTSLAERPVFSLLVGGAFRNYPSILVEDRKGGVTAGVNLRLLNIAQTVFLHAYAGATYFKVGDVGTGSNYFRNVRDLTYHIGPMLEIGLGRRFSLFGTFFRRSNYLTAEPPLPGETQSDIRVLEFIGEPTVYKFGLGAQWDFYVIPHGSIGVRGYVEQDFGYVALTMALEPAPAKKFSLDFQPSDQR